MRHHTASRSVRLRSPAVLSGGPPWPSRPPEGRVVGAFGEVMTGGGRAIDSLGTRLGEPCPEEESE